MEFWGTEPEIKRTLWPDGWDEGTYWTWTKSYPDGRDYGRPLATGRRVCGWEEGHATLLVAADTRPVLDTDVGQLSSRAKKNDGTVEVRHTRPDKPVAITGKPDSPSLPEKRPQLSKVLEWWKQVQTIIPDAS